MCYILRPLGDFLAKFGLATAISRVSVADKSEK